MGRKYTEAQKRATMKWREKNKLKFQEYSKKRYNSTNDGYYRVYLIDDYVGMSINIKNRMYWHKNVMKRDISNYRVLYKTKSKKDARELESLLHDMGYKGSDT